MSLGSGRRGSMEAGIDIIERHRLATLFSLLRLGVIARGVCNLSLLEGVRGSLPYTLISAFIFGASQYIILKQANFKYCSFTPLSQNLIDWILRNILLFSIEEPTLIYCTSKHF
jgi:hypothetical protein